MSTADTQGKLYDWKTNFFPAGREYNLNHAEQMEGSGLSCVKFSNFSVFIYACSVSWRNIVYPAFKFRRTLIQKVKEHIEKVENNHQHIFLKK